MAKVMKKAIQVDGGEMREVSITPSKDMYRLVIKMTQHSLDTIMADTIMEVDRDTLIANGVDWEPKTGDICPAPLFGVFVD